MEFLKGKNGCRFKNECRYSHDIDFTQKGVCTDMLINGDYNNGYNCLYTHQIPDILIKDSKFLDSVIKNEVKNSLDENSIFKSDPVNINTQQSSFLLQMKTMYLETSKMFQQM